MRQRARDVKESSVQLQGRRMALWYTYLAAILGFVAVFGLPAKHGQSDGDALMDQMYDLSLKEQNNELKPNNQMYDVITNDPKLEVKPEEQPHNGDQTKNQRLDAKDKGHGGHPKYRSFHMDPRDRNGASPKEGSPISPGNIHVDADPLYVNVEQKDNWHDVKIENQRLDSDPQERRADIDRHRQELRSDADSHAPELRSYADRHSNSQKLWPDADPRSNSQELRSNTDLRSHSQQLRPYADQVERNPTFLQNALVAGATNVNVEPKYPNYDIKIVHEKPDADSPPQWQRRRPDADPRPHSQSQGPGYEADNQEEISPVFDKTLVASDTYVSIKPKDQTYDIKIADPHPQEPTPDKALQPQPHSQSQVLTPEADHQEGSSAVVDKTLVANNAYVNVEPMNPNYDIKIVNPRPDAHHHQQELRPNADHQDRISTVLHNTLVAGVTNVDVEPNDPTYDIKIEEQSPAADPRDQKSDATKVSSSSLDHSLVAGHTFVNVEPQDPNDVDIQDQWLDADPVDKQYIRPKDGNTIPTDNAYFAGATLFINIKPKDQSHDVMPEYQMYDASSEDQLYHVNPANQMYEDNTDEDRNDDTEPSEDDWQNTIHAEHPDKSVHPIHSTPLFTMYGKVEGDIEMHPESNGSALVASEEPEPPGMRNPRPFSMLLKKMLLTAVHPGKEGESRSDEPGCGSSNDSKDVPVSTKQASFETNIKSVEPQSTPDEPKLRKLSEILVGIKRRLDNGREESKDRGMFSHLLTYTSIAVVIFVVLSFLTMMTLLCWSVQHM